MKLWLNQNYVGWPDEDGMVSHVKKSGTDSCKEQGAGAIDFYRRLETICLDYSA